MLNNEFPDFRNINFDREPNMTFVKDMCDDLKSQGYRYLPKETSGIFHDLASQSSTVNLFQIVNIQTLTNLQKNLKSNSQLMTDQSTLDLKNECVRKYPVLYERLKNAALMPLSNGNIPSGIKKIIFRDNSVCHKFLLETGNTRPRCGFYR